MLSTAAVTPNTTVNSPLLFTIEEDAAAVTQQIEIVEAEEEIEEDEEETEAEEDAE